MLPLYLYYSNTFLGKLVQHSNASAVGTGHRLHKNYIYYYQYNILYSFYKTLLKIRCDQTEPFWDGVIILFISSLCL